ncbi:MAG: Protein kinase [Watsoniomyces obsoletus]|nr:MAG: Protein kinase [Watsoniomyces obsoletus]
MRFFTGSVALLGLTAIQHVWAHPQNPPSKNDAAAERKAERDAQIEHNWKLAKEVGISLGIASFLVAGTGVALTVIDIMHRGTDAEKCLVERLEQREENRYINNYHGGAAARKAAGRTSVWPHAWVHLWDLVNACEQETGGYIDLDKESTREVLDGGMKRCRRDCDSRLAALVQAGALRGEDLRSSQESCYNECKDLWRTSWMDGGVKPARNALQRVKRPPENTGENVHKMVVDTVNTVQSGATNFKPNFKMNMAAAGPAMAQFVSSNLAKVKMRAGPAKVLI